MEKDNWHAALLDPFLKNVSPFGFRIDYLINNPAYMFGTLLWSIQIISLIFIVLFSRASQLMYNVILRQSRNK